MPHKSFHLCLGIIHTVWLGHKAQHPINVPCHHHAPPVLLESMFLL